MSGAFVTLDGAAGTRISTPDVNLLDADTAHLQQSIGPWGALTSAGAPTQSTALPPVFGTQHGRWAGRAPVGSTSALRTSASVTNPDDGPGKFPVSAGDEVGFSGYVASELVGAGGANPKIALRIAWAPSNTITAETAVEMDEAGKWFFARLPLQTAPAGTTHAVAQLIVRDGQGENAEYYFDGLTMYVGTEPQEEFVPSLRIVGDIDMQLDFIDTDEALKVLINRHNGSTDRAYRLIMSNNGSLYFVYSEVNTVGGIAAVSLNETVELGRKTVRGTRVVSTGENKNFLNGVVRAQNTSLVGQAGKAVDAGPSINLAIGAYVGGGGEAPLTVYSGTVRDGIDGPIVAGFNAGQLPFASGPIPDLTEWTDPSGRVWTFHGGITFTEASSAPPDFKVKRYAEGVGSGRDITIMDGSMSIKRYESV